MKSIGYKLVCLCALFGAVFANANEEQADVGAWSLGVNLGLGQRSAFITGQDDLDIYLLPDFHYYGEQWFLDNGTLGYTLSEQNQYALSLIAEVNPYGLYFEQSAFGESFTPLYLFSPNAISGEATEEDAGDLHGFVSTGPVDPSSEHPNSGNNLKGDAYQLPKPDLSLDFGIQGNWFLADNQDITFKLVSDISSKHSGYRAKFNWSLRHQISEVKLRLNIGFDWLSADASNYYFGISPEQSSSQMSHYETGSTVNPFVSVTGSLPLTKNISLVAHLKYLKLDSAITNSPLTSQGHSVTHFAGIHYKFW